MERNHALFDHFAVRPVKGEEPASNNKSKQAKHYRL